jgi:hypothetical protein
VSNGDFNLKSPKPLFVPVVAAINGHIRTAVGCGNESRKKEDGITEVLQIPSIGWQAVRAAPQQIFEAWLASDDARKSIV